MGGATIIPRSLNPLPHGVLTTFFPTAGGLMGPPNNDDISRGKTILVTSLRTHRAFAVSRPELLNAYSPPPIDRSLCTLPASHLSRQIFEIFPFSSFVLYK